MSAFLAQLAGIALGEPAAGAARLSLRPRYAQTRAGDAGFEEVRVEEPLGGPLLRPGRESGHRPSTHDRAPDAGPPRSVPTPAERLAAPQPVEPVGRDAGKIRPQGPPSRRAAAPHGAQSRVPRPAPLPLRTIADDPLLPPAPAAMPSGGTRLADAGPNAPLRPPPQRTPPQLTAREMPSAPLSDRALVGRTERPRKVEPVIHVTIDRIEVRAPASPPPAAAARRTPAEPSVSLSDFLRGGRPGTRQ